MTSSGERIWNCRQSDEQVAEKLHRRTAQSRRGGLDKLAAKSDVTLLTFGELAEKYLSQYPFNKQSTRELCEQIVRNLLMPKWSEEITVEIDPPQLKAWLVALDVESSTRGKDQEHHVRRVQLGPIRGIDTSRRAVQSLPLREGAGIQSGHGVRGSSSWDRRHSQSAQRTQAARV